MHTFSLVRAGQQSPMRKASKAIVQFHLTEIRNSAGDASLCARNDDTADYGDKVLELLDARSNQGMGEFGQRRVREVLAWEDEGKRSFLQPMRLLLRGWMCLKSWMT